MSVSGIPAPENEMGCLRKLSELDIDYSDMQESLQYLSKLAAKVAGMPISLINLIVSFTQWTYQTMVCLCNRWIVLILFASIPS